MVEAGRGRSVSGSCRANTEQRRCEADQGRRRESTPPVFRALREGANAEMERVRIEVLDRHREHMRKTAMDMQAQGLQEQERMQRQQEKEGELAKQLAEAKAGIEARLCPSPALPAAVHKPSFPAYGPTGQRWDQPQGLLHAARPQVQGGQVDDGEHDESQQRPRQRGRWAVETDEGLPAAFRGRTNLPAAFRARRWHSLGPGGGGGGAAARVLEVPSP